MKPERTTIVLGTYDLSESQYRAWVEWVTKLAPDDYDIVSQPYIGGHTRSDSITCEYSLAGCDRMANANKWLCATWDAFLTDGACPDADD